jgi:hypothetical protein
MKDKRIATWPILPDIPSLLIQTEVKYIIRGRRGQRSVGRELFGNMSGEGVRTVNGTFFDTKPIFDKWQWFV